MFDRMAAFFAEQFEDYAMTISGDYPDERYTRKFTLEAIEVFAEFLRERANEGGMPHAIDVEVTIRGMLPKE